MLSLTKGKEVCFIKSKDNDLNKQVIHYNEDGDSDYVVGDKDESKGEKYNELSSRIDSGMNIVLDKESEFEVMYNNYRVILISGMSNSGKSYIANRIAEHYIAQKKGDGDKPNIYLFNPKGLEVDTTYSAITKKYVKPIKLNRFGESFDFNDFQKQVMEDEGLFIFDDYDSINLKQGTTTYVNVLRIKNWILEVGRQYNLRCIIITHRTNKVGNDMDYNLRECDSCVIFPRNRYTDTFGLELGIDKRAMKELLSLKGKERSLFIDKHNHLAIGKKYLIRY